MKPDHVLLAAAQIDVTKRSVACAQHDRSESVDDLPAAGADGRLQGSVKRGKLDHMNLNRALFRSALTDTGQRPGALRDLQAFLTAGGHPDLLMEDLVGGFTLLTHSAAMDWIDAVRVLLAAGADVHTNDDGALRWAARNGHLPVVECLLAAGADVHALHDLALCWASEREHRSIVECLLAAGADASVMWTWVHPKMTRRKTVAATLDAAAAAIPAEQAGALIRADPLQFPAIRALRSAERRQLIAQRALPKRRIN